MVYKINSRTSKLYMFAFSCSSQSSLLFVDETFNSMSNVFLHSCSSIGEPSLNSVSTCVNKSKLSLSLVIFSSPTVELHLSGPHLNQLL